MGKFWTKGINKKTGTRYDENGYDISGFNQKGIHKTTKTRYNTNGFDKNAIHIKTHTKYDELGYDKNGYDKNGYNRLGYDKDGYNKLGYDKNGYDRTGYNKLGYDKDDYDREGYNRLGYDKNGYDKTGYNKLGYDKFGYDKKGFNQDGIHKITKTQYNKDGYDINGYNEKGFNREGINEITGTKYNLVGYDINGFDMFGYNKSGYDKDGFNKLGFNKSGINKYTKTKYDTNGYDRHGFDKDGVDINGNKKIEEISSLKVNFKSISKEDIKNKNYTEEKSDVEKEIKTTNKVIHIYDKNGYDEQGYNRLGYDKNGYDREGYDSEGYNKKGFSRDKIYKYTQTRYDRFGFDCDGYDEEGFNHEGYNKYGKSRRELENKEKEILIIEKSLKENFIDEIAEEKNDEKLNESKKVLNYEDKEDIIKNSLIYKTVIPTRKTPHKIKLINVEKTEILAEVKSRRGHNEFKNNLLAVEQCCKICGLSNENSLLIASHIKPWNKSNDSEKIDYNNGFLLCPNHDKLFDKGFISFDDNGVILVSSLLSRKDLKLLGINKDTKIEVREENKKYLKYHREYIFKK